MATSLSLAVYLLLFILFAFVWIRSNRAPVVVTPFLLFGGFEIISVWPAMVYADASGISTSGAFPTVVAGLGFVAFLAGFVVSTASGHASSAQPGAFRDRSVQRQYPDAVYLMAIGVIACGLAGLGFYVYQGLPPVVDGLQALQQGPDGIPAAINIIAAGREEVTKGHYLGQPYRGQGVILELTQDGWPYLVAIAAVLYIVTRKRRWLLTSVVLFVLMLFFIAGSGQRWQVLAALLCLGIMLFLVARPKKRWIAANLGGMVLIYIGMSVLNPTYEGIENTDDPLGSFVALATSRIGLGNGLHDVEGMNFIQDGSLEWGLGTIHAQKLLSSIPGVGKNDVPFAARLAVLLDPNRPETDSTYASQTYLGWLYMDFGLPGVAVVFFLIGALLARAQALIFAGHKDVLNVPARGFVIFYLGSLALDGPATVGASLLVVGGLYLTIRLCADLLASPYRRLAIFSPARIGA
jgi:hypothetical protein